MLKIFGHRKEGGSFLLGKVASLSISGSLDSPAISARAFIVPEKKQPELISFSIKYNENVLWKGVVDYQSECYGENGHSLHLEGRNCGGVLLDNEALPSTLWSANLTTLFMRYLAPYGFRLEQKVSGQTLPVFTVYKGMSLWDIFTRFTQRLYGISPYARENQVYVAPLSWRPELVFSNTRRGERYCQLESITSPYEILSEVVVRDSEGYYSARVGNPVAERYAVQRRRYHIPPSEFVDAPKQNAHQRIQRSLYDSKSWKVVVPKLLPTSVGTGVSIEEEGFSKRGLIVHQWTQEISDKGAQTTFLLKDSTYW